MKPVRVVAAVAVVVVGTLLLLVFASSRADDGRRAATPAGAGTEAVSEAPEDAVARPEATAGPDVEGASRPAPDSAITGVVLDPDDQPIPRARVAVDGIRSALAPTRDATMTDGSGRFSLPMPEQRGAVHLVASHREFGASDVVLATAGQAVTLRLVAPAEIRGQVVGEGGGPLPGVWVSLRRRKDFDDGVHVEGIMLDGGLAYPATTDAEGRFALRNAPRGRLELLSYHAEYVPGVHPVDVPAGAKVVDAGRVELSQGLGVGGIVVDEKGRPVPGVVLNFGSIDGGWPRSTEGGRSHAQGFTDQDGRFAVHGLKKGRFRVRLPTGSQHYVEPDSVLAGEKDVRIVHHRGARLLGRVTAHALPVEGAQVEAETAGEGARATSDADGRFAIHGLSPTRPFRLRIRHTAYRSRAVESVRVTAEEQEFVLEEGLQIRGVVVDAEDKPVAGAVIACWYAPDLEVDDGTDTPVRSAMTRSGAEGDFLIGGLEAGEYLFSVDVDDQDFVPIHDLKLQAGDTKVRIVLEHGEVISGRVVVSRGDPASAVEVEVLDGKGELINAWSAREGGRFECRGLRPGRYTVRAYMADEKGEEGPATTVPDVATGTKDLEIRLAD